MRVFRLIRAHYTAEEAHKTLSIYLEIIDAVERQYDNT